MAANANAADTNQYCLAADMIICFVPSMNSIIAIMLFAISGIVLLISSII